MVELGVQVEIWGGRARKAGTYPRGPQPPPTQPPHPRGATAPPEDPRTPPSWGRPPAAPAALAPVTVLLRWLRVSNAATVSTSYLMVVLVVAATSASGRRRDLDRGDAVPQFLLPAAGRHVHDRRSAELGALFAFLAVSLVASNLSAVAQRADRRKPSAAATSWPGCSISAATC